MTNEKIEDLAKQNIGPRAPFNSPTYTRGAVPRTPYNSPSNQSDSFFNPPGGLVLTGTNKAIILSSELSEDDEWVVKMEEYVPEKKDIEMKTFGKPTTIIDIMKDSGKEKDDTTADVNKK